MTITRFWPGRNVSYERELHSRDLNYQIENEQLQSDGTQIDDQRQALGIRVQPKHQHRQQAQIPVRLMTPVNPGDIPSLLVHPHDSGAVLPPCHQIRELAALTCATPGPWGFLHSAVAAA